MLLPSKWRVLAVLLTVAAGASSLGAQTSNPKTQENNSAPTAETDPETRAMNKVLLNSRPTSERTFLPNLLADQETLWTRPWHLRANDAQWGFPFAAATSLLIGSDTSIEKRLPANKTWIRRSQTFSNLGAASLVGTAGAFYLWGTMAHQDHARETGLLSAEALANSMFLTQALKLSFTRQRPAAGNGKGEFWQGGSSFPSDHAAAAWSVASVIAHEYPGPMTKFLAYGAATAISVSRVTGRQHFASDVFIGSALGWYLGRQVYGSHHNPELGGASFDDPSESAIGESGDEEHTPATTGSPDVPLDSWIYPALERLAALGYIRTAFLGQRPWTRMECARLLAEAGEQVEADDARDAQVDRLYNALQGELRRETGDTVPTRTLRLDSVYLRLTGISGTPLQDGFHFGQTIVNDFGRPYGEGFNAVGGVTAHAAAGPFSFQIQGEYQHSPSVASDPASVQQATANLDVTHPLANGRGQIDRFRLVSGTIGLTLNNLRFSFGRQSLWLGPGATGPFLFSNNADAMMMLRIEPATPYRIPLLSQLLGPVRSEFFLARLTGQKWEYSPVLYGPRLRSQPFMHGTKISFRPTPNLEMGLGFTAQFGGDGNPFTWSNFLRTFYSHRVGISRNPAKRLSQFDFVYRIPRLRNWLQVYADSMVIDEYSPLGSTRPAINPGIYLAKIPKLHHVDFRFEGVTTDLNVPNHFGSGAFYWDTRYRSGYTNDGNLIGSWVGRSGRGEQGWLTYRFSPRSYIQFQYRHNNVDKSLLEGGRLQDLGLAAEHTFRSGIGLSGSVQHEAWRFPLLTPVGQANVKVGFTIAYGPKWSK
jgi:membrane-associated phospholipid phosphatase